MAVFAIIPTSAQNEVLESAINSKFGSKAYKLPMGQWLVSYSGTSKVLSDELGITEGKGEVSAIVVSISGYYGRAPTDVWEWIKLNWEP